MASDILNTTISKLMMDNGYGLKLFIQTEDDATRDGGHCHTNGTWDYVVSTGDEFGKQIHAQLLAAYAAKKKVNLIGSDTCIVNGNIEGLQRLEVF